MAIAYQKQLLEHSIEIQEKERSRIAADLHDELIGQLHRLKLMNNDPGLNDVLGNSISTARRISHDLTPPLLNEIPLHEMMVDFVQPFKANFAVDFQTKSLSEVNIDVASKLHLFRIFQELIINASKHAKAQNMEITLRESKQQLMLYLKDDGVGMPPQSANGIGMKNIELRALALNAKYRLRAGKTRGTAFILIFNPKSNQP